MRASPSPPAEPTAEPSGEGVEFEPSGLMEHQAGIGPAEEIAFEPSEALEQEVEEPEDA